ncbi:MAG: heme NO-binding domain-containing protein, partial [Fidelibacterota bacterium]
RGLHEESDYNAKLTQLSRQFGLPREIILYESGHYIFKEFIKKFPETVIENKSPRRFFDSVEKLIRTELRGYFDEEALPEIAVSRIEEDTIVIKYRSKRMSCTIIEGIIKSIADYYGRKITYSHPTCQNRGDSFCAFNLHFYDKNYN